MSQVKRYREGGYGVSEMEESTDGDWVDYADYAAMQQRAEEAEAALEVEKDIHDDTVQAMQLWCERAKEAEAKLAELAKQKPRYQIQKRLSYGRESLWIDVASREEAENNVIHGFRWRMVYDASAPAVNLAELVPDGWKLVPVEITQEMLDAHFEGVCTGGIQAGYRAMLAAAPEVK